MLCINAKILVLHERKMFDLYNIPSCKRMPDMLFFRYKETSLKGDSKKDEGFPNIFRLYKIVSQTK